MRARRRTFTAPFAALLQVFWVFCYKAAAFPFQEPLLPLNSAGEFDARELGAHVRTLSQTTPALPSLELDLLFAARDGDSSKAEEAIRLGATGRASTPHELFTALIFAARGGHASVVQLLLDLGVDPNWQTRSGMTALWIAAYMGHTETVQALLDADSAIVDLANSNGMTPLFAASQQEHMDIVVALLSKGANPETPSENGATPLVAATQVGDSMIVDILAVKGADVNARKQPLLRPALWIASYLGHFDVVKTLIAWGADVNLAADDGRTSLFAASQQDWEMVVLMLLENNADMTLSRHDGLTPLHIAALLGHFGIVKALIRNGADTTAINDKGQTAGDLLGMRNTDIPDEITDSLTKGSVNEENLFVSTSSDLYPAPESPYSLVPTQVDEVVQPPRNQEDLDEVDPVLHSSNPTNVSSSKSRLSAASIAILLPLTLLGVLLIVSIALIAKRQGEACANCIHSLSDCEAGNECMSRPAGVHPNSSVPYRHTVMESSPSPEIIDVAFADAQIEMSPQRNAMETHRSHIFLDGHYPEDVIPQGGTATEVVPTSTTQPAMTWNWMSEDGPGLGAEDGALARQDGVGMLSRCITGGRLDSTMLHEELRLDEEIQRSQREMWWSSSRKLIDSQRSMVSRTTPDGLPHPLGYTSPLRIVTATNAVPVGLSTEVDFRVSEHMPIVAEASSREAERNFHKPIENLQEDSSEVLTRHSRRSRSEGLFYYMKDGVRTKVSGNTVRMTADEGSSSNPARTDGDRNKRIIRVLYKNS